MADLEIELFPCLSDNFGVLIHDPSSGQTASIDAPEEGPILEALKRRGWNLTHIFITHHHHDHVGGVEALKSQFKAKIFGPAREKDKIANLDQTFDDGDTFEFSGHPVHVISTPGHTLGHICYHLPEDKLLFAADTLFALGCGRVFEGTMEDMWQSLTKLAALPDDTQVYFGHEYTQSNARYAVTVEPDNAALIARAAEIDAERAAGRFTAPTSIGTEKETNPFLHADSAERFAEIRKGKDNFK
ncbi:hydroxyacylglutathione hydrolase [Rhizobium sp. L1K21]|uniref:hydroxyacylglutathione hydrolase n=1 Tax=Rhizobium sp. L1K21 TaxID=2954933 RepID=UPI002093483B|nr:hydroxyacylglutathione hydrolase [Rhizobium sp. L1K21]MCO6188160.1 hydroxyacylglutathione hydrolase [Rhizobium sp. L1K21]